MPNLILIFVPEMRCLPMKWEWFIAKRLRLSEGGGSGSPSLGIALAGIVLSVVVMIFSIVIVTGFKNEITGKIYNLDAHIKVSDAYMGDAPKLYNTVNYAEISNVIRSDSVFSEKIRNFSLVAEKSAVLKTDNEFKGVILRGADSGYDWTYLTAHLLQGRVPAANAAQEVIISKTVASELGVAIGDKLFAYFIGEKVKVRRPVVVGIFSTDFDAFDDNIILCDISLLQGVNEWNRDTGNYLAVNMRDLNHLHQDALQLYSLLATAAYKEDVSAMYNVADTHSYNTSFFSWLGMLDMNVVIILTLMIIVAMFTLVAALLMIILERIKFIGVIKAQGATNASVRRIFLLLTGKLIIRALLIGNALGIGLALVQQHFHVIRLNPEAYYMPWVPISINLWAIAALNVAVIVVSYVSLIAPSHIISTIKPTTTLRYE